jgi:hypothetical protein
MDKSITNPTLPRYAFDPLDDATLAQWQQIRLHLARLQCQQAAGQLLAWAWPVGLRQLFFTTSMGTIRTEPLREWSSAGLTVIRHRNFGDFAMASEDVAEKIEAFFESVAKNLPDSWPFFEALSSETLHGNVRNAAGFARKIEKAYNHSVGLERGNIWKKEQELAFPERLNRVLPEGGPDHPKSRL